MRAASRCSAPPAGSGRRTGPRPPAGSRGVPLTAQFTEHAPAAGRFQQAGQLAQARLRCGGRRRRCAARRGARRSSLSPLSALARMSAKLSSSSGGGSATFRGAASAWMAITDMWWATMSCSSRAMRWRSWSSARSPSRRRACWASSARPLRRTRTIAPASSGMAMRSVPALVRASMAKAPSTVSTATVATNQGLPRTATEYRHRAYTSRPAGTYTAVEKERGPTAAAVQASSHDRRAPGHGREPGPQQERRTDQEREEEQYHGAVAVAVHGVLGLQPRVRGAEQDDREERVGQEHHVERPALEALQPRRVRGRGIGGAVRDQGRDPVRDPRTHAPSVSAGWPPLRDPRGVSARPYSGRGPASQVAPPGAGAGTSGAGRQWVPQRDAGYAGLSVAFWPAPHWTRKDTP